MNLTRTAPSFAILACSVLAGCVPNPRNEIGAIAEAAMVEATRTSPAASLCVERTITPWQSADEVRRHDPPAPPGFEHLYTTRVFRGGGGIKGASIGGVAVRGGKGCFDLRGPLVDGDRAMIEVHLPGMGWNVWTRRTDGDWRVVMTTTSTYLD